MKGILYELYRYAICKPGVDERNTPPLNASNLNDISNALQAVNITQQERTTLGAEATDTLGQILAALKNAIDENIGSINQEIQSIKTQIGGNKYAVGSYIGNGQDTLSLTFGFTPKAIFVYSSEVQQSTQAGEYAWWYYWIYNATKLYVNLVGRMRLDTGVLLSGNTITFRAKNPRYILNSTTATVYYIVFG